MSRMPRSADLHLNRTSARLEVTTRPTPSWTREPQHLHLSERERQSCEAQLSTRLPLDYNSGVNPVWIVSVASTAARPPSVVSHPAFRRASTRRRHGLKRCLPWPTRGPTTGTGTQSGLRAAALLACLMFLTTATDARADEATSIEARPPASHGEQPARPEVSKATHARRLPTGSKRALSAGASLVPGVVAHGTGHFVLGEPAIGRRLLFAELAGMGLIFAGGVPIFLTGASRYIVGPSAAAVVLGVGLFGTSFAADMYGTLSRDGGAVGSRVRPPPWIETELGYRHISDPVFDYEHFLYERISMMSGPLRVTPSAWFATTGDNARYRVEGGYRLLGAHPSLQRAALWNDHLDIVIGLVHHRYTPQRFARSSAEAAIDTRYDLGHVGSTLRGAFVEAAVGYARGRIGYDIPGIDVPADTDSLLLARFGFGVVLRGKSMPGSQITVYYDHRHDDFAAGWIMPGLGSGVAGHLGSDVRWFFTRNLGVSAMAQYGSAFVTGLSVMFRQPGALGERARGGG